MQEPHSKGVANHADLGSCAGGGDIAGEAWTEALAGRPIGALISRVIANVLGLVCAVHAAGLLTSFSGLLAGKSMKETLKTAEMPTGTLSCARLPGTSIP